MVSLEGCLSNQGGWDMDWDTLKDYEPVELEDSVDFRPLKGAYVCRVESIQRKKGTSAKGNEYDFWSFRAQVIETIEGDKGDNRFLDKTYGMIMTSWTTPEDEMKRLLNDLFTNGLEYDLSSEEAFEVSLESLIDKIVNVRAWVRTSKKDGNKYQSFKFVKVIKGRESSKGSEETVKAPF